MYKYYKLVGILMCLNERLLASTAHESKQVVCNGKMEF